MRPPSIFDIIICQPENHPECGGWMVSRADGIAISGPFPNRTAAAAFREHEIRRLEIPGVATVSNTIVSTSLDDPTDLPVPRRVSYGPGGQR